MSWLRHRVSAELRLLPGILGKLIGGALVVTGMGGVVLGLKHDSVQSIALGATALLAGLLLFFTSSGWLNSRKTDAAIGPDEANASRKMNLLTWGLFACIVVALLLIARIAFGT